MTFYDDAFTAGAGLVRRGVRDRQHYDRLGVGDRLEWDLHEGGHEIRCETGLAFLRKWLG